MAMSSLALSMTAARAAPLPGGFAHSGWFQFELVVLIDTQATTLASETWPLLPNVGYPARWRWLKDSELIDSLSEVYPDAAVTASPSGQVWVRFPPPEPTAWIPPEPEAEPEPAPELAPTANAAPATADGAFPWEEAPTPEQIDSSDESMIAEFLATASPANATESPMQRLAGELDAEHTQAASSPTLLPIESLRREAATDTLIALEDLNAIDLFPKPREQEVMVPFAMPVERPDLAEVTVAARPIPTPEAFVRRPMERLASGLRRYLATSDDQLMISASWLQGPDSDALPLVLEPHSDDGFPLLQGFVQLLPRENTFRLGVNFWANTTGAYLPERFEMPGPPASPQRVAVIVPSQISVTSDLNDGAHDREAAQTNPGTNADLETPVAHLMPRPSAVSAGLPPEWPWRHLIHVADTVTLEEERIRYLDHPVIKVIATWREWSWYEVFLHGREMARSARDLRHPKSEIANKEMAASGRIALPPQL